MGLLRRIGPLGQDFDSFVREASTSLLRTATLLAGDREIAEDLVQQALLRTARRWEAARLHPHGYARQVLVNLSKDQARDSARRPRQVPLSEAVGQGPAQELPEGQLLLRHVLLGAVQQLPHRQRAVVVLRFFEDLPVTEVAEILACTEGTVKSQTHRALVTLRGLLAGFEGQHPSCLDDLDYRLEVG